MYSLQKTSLHINGVSRTKLNKLKLRTHSVLLSVTNLLKNTLGFFIFSKIRQAKTRFCKDCRYKKVTIHNVYCKLEEDNGRRVIFHSKWRVILIEINSSTYNLIKTNKIPSIREFCAQKYLGFFVSKKI